MVELRTTLTDDERDIINRLNAKHHRLAREDKKHDAYYKGTQRLKHLGLAVPEELRILELVINWPGMYVDELMRRQKVKSVYQPGSDGRGPADKPLQEGFTANNLASEIPILCKEMRIFGRGMLSVGTNEDDPEHPLIRVESPQQMTVLVDSRKRRIVAALRQYYDEDMRQRVGTLLLPDKTIQIVIRAGIWDLDIVGDDNGVDEHGLGRVPVVLALNRRRLGHWDGETEMRSVMPITDACARTLTDLQYGVETVAMPKRYALGFSKNDFVDKNGNPQPTWQTYLDALWATQKSLKDAHIGQLPGADISGFHNTVKMYAELASSVTGLPFRYFGANTANPAAEGAIRADESRIVSNVEESNTHVGVALGWTMALYERFRTGEWPAAGLPIALDWRDASTPTLAEEADSIVKKAGGVPVLSREGSWDEMGWDEARKARELGYFAAEAENDPVNRLARDLNTNGAGNATAAATGIG
ncbi:phage portal protein [Nocardia africana]|uniref:Phage portal protein, SPP1 Gp6-like n=1 Tax=Nocardia africana TaxID=134964 RepID=A0A378X3J3_9NOCA|nr:phage portal protein [Nocardia africana]MCC3311517.1 phage portal protein [Nocardia africana]SUA47221.1 Phage portal protein, SPP1 Gp6-like [Nocardia africana]